MALTIPRTGRQSVAGNFPSKTATHLHLGRVKWRLIIFHKDKTRSTYGSNQTLDPQIQNPTLYRLSQQAPIHMTCCALNAIGEAQPHLPHGSCSKPNFNLMGPKLHRSYSTSEYIAQAPIRYYALYIMIIDTKCNVLNCTELLISL